MEEIITRVGHQKFKVKPAALGTKIVTPISGGKSLTIELFPVNTRNSDVLTPETVPFCAHLEWISNRIKSLRQNVLNTNVDSYNLTASKSYWLTKGFDNMHNLRKIERYKFLLYNLIGFAKTSFFINTGKGKAMLYLKTPSKHHLSTKLNELI